MDMSYFIPYEITPTTQEGCLINRIDSPTNINTSKYELGKQGEQEITFTYFVLCFLENTGQKSYQYSVQNCEKIKLYPGKYTNIQIPALIHHL